MPRTTFVAIAALLWVAVLTSCLPPRQSSGPAGPSHEPPARQHEPLIVFLVRHAEKVKTGDDPGLSEAGLERTAVLVDTLRSAKIETVHSSDYFRTRETAMPVAARLGVEMELYDPRDLPALAEKLRGLGGRHLVVGHSNTTPAMVELLGGDPGTPIDEHGENDRLYVVTLGPDGTASTVLLRFGAPYRPGSR